MRMPLLDIHVISGLSAQVCLNLIAAAEATNMWTGKSAFGSGTPTADVSLSELAGSLAAEDLLEIERFIQRLGECVPFCAPCMHKGVLRMIASRG